MLARTAEDLSPRSEPGPRCPKEMAATDFHSEGGEVQSDVWEPTGLGKRFRSAEPV
jgi:hypothetical protein